jgi:acetyl-CoA decarbonylase/synthase complex subunit beta
MHADGGYNRVVWMPQETKERLRQFIPETVYPAIATENEVKNIPDLKKFLEDNNHPVKARWETSTSGSADRMNRPLPVFSAGDIPMNVGGFRIILKNAKITAEKVIILPVRPDGQEGGEQSGSQ